MEKRYDAMLLLGLELGEGDQPEEELIRRAEGGLWLRVEPLTTGQ